MHRLLQLPLQCYKSLYRIGRDNSSSPLDLSSATDGVLEGQNLVLVSRADINLLVTEAEKMKAIAEVMMQLSSWLDFLFFFFMNGNTERAQCALSQVCIPQEMGKAVKIKKVIKYLKIIQVGHH